MQEALLPVDDVDVVAAGVLHETIDPRKCHRRPCATRPAIHEGFPPAALPRRSAGSQNLVPAGRRTLEWTSVSS